VPSITEFLLDIGVNVVCRTKFCIYPEDKISEIPVIGGTKKFRLNAIKELHPDLIVGNKEENYEDGIVALQRDFPLYLSNIVTIDQAISMMHDLAILTDRIVTASGVIAAIRERYQHYQGRFAGKVLYLIWQNPFMAAGSDTYINHMLTWIGFENVMKKSRYPQLSTDELASLDAEIIMLSSEPYPFKEKDVEQIKMIAAASEVKLVNGEFFSWYGTRILRSTPEH
jgi:ABC-type Fe3+-hydroxamate transport system substrate-binding protein